MPTQPASTGDAYLALRRIVKRYPGGVTALDGVDLAVGRGEVVCLLGPSGCGKSTLLRLVAGLEHPDQGSLYFDGRDLATIPVHRRGFGLMFQDFALFPHRTVAQNIAFGLRMAGWDTARIDARVAAMLELVNLTGYGPRSVLELSGGERQRVALARSLAPNPALLMLDEPLGSLDRGLRESLLEELRAILRDIGVTALYVTHDQEEALALGDRIAVMNRGRIEQIAAPDRLYTQPATPFVARFLGFTNLLPATRLDDRTVMTPLGLFPVASPPPPVGTLLIRPEAARLDAQMSHANTWRSDALGISSVGLGVTLEHWTYHGHSYRIKVVAGTHTQRIPLAFQLPAYQRAGNADRLIANVLPASGERIGLRIYPHLTTVLPYPPE